MSGFFPSYPNNKFPQTGTLASQPRGMNFAQTARAEELKAARARKAAHDDHEQSQQQQQREQGLGLPTRGPIPLGAYTVFKKRTRTKHGKAQGRSERSRNENDSQEELSRPASTVPSIPSIPEENENENEGNVNTNAQMEQMGSTHKKRESMVSGYERYLREQANKAAGSASGLGRMPMPNEATTTTATNATATTTSTFSFFQPPTIPNIPTAAHAHDQNAGLNPHHHTGDFQWREDMSRHPTLVASYGRNTDKDYARLTPSSHQSSRISSLLTRQGPRYPAAGVNDYITFPQPGPAASTEGSASEDEDPFGYDGGQGVSLNPAHPTNTNAPSGKENGHGYTGKDLYWDHSNM
ncbi:MAG: hypothetical protein OHK93_006317 [Ramalina farinacea]|uniref:Uncharacterized protein n=1 Tax=Ramalina farinacea TaxID=258253 RepID=A0AA43QKK8_9LECA|nr:hypothetical protein [Ramalina farinacea]